MSIGLRALLKKSDFHTIDEFEKIGRSYYDATGVSAAQLLRDMNKPIIFIPGYKSNDLVWLTSLQGAQDLLARRRFPSSGRVNDMPSMIIPTEKEIKTFVGETPARSAVPFPISATRAIMTIGDLTPEEAELYKNYYEDEVARTERQGNLVAGQVAGRKKTKPLPKPTPWWSSVWSYIQKNPWKVGLGGLGLLILLGLLLGRR